MILVVGGAGFIGSHVAKMLQKEGYEALVLDNFSTGHSGMVLQGRIIQGEMGDAAALDAIFREYPIAAVMHFASSTDVGESSRRPAEYYANNVSASLTLFNAMIKHGVKFLVFSSSAAIFGSSHSSSIDENHPCLPINPYGWTKRIVEQALGDYDRAYGLKSCCLRYFNAAGGDSEGKIKILKSRFTNLIPIAMASAQQDKEITIFGTDYPTFDGTCIRDYVHVEDLGQAHILGLQQLVNTNASCHYNLGNGRGYSVWEVIHTLEKVIGKKVKTVLGDRRGGDPSILIANPSKAKRELGWECHFPDLKEMIEHAWKAYHVEG